MLEEAAQPAPTALAEGDFGMLAYIILGGFILLVSIMTGLTLKYLLHPGEKGKDHIKRRILTDPSEHRSGGPPR